MCKGLLLLIIIEYIHSPSVKDVWGSLLQARDARAVQYVSLTPCALDSFRAPNLHPEGAVSVLVLGLMTCVNLSKSLSSLGATLLTFVKQDSDWSPDQSSHCPAARPPPPHLLRGSSEPCQAALPLAGVGGMKLTFRKRG